MVVSSEADDDDVYFLLAGSCRVSYFSSSGREVSFRDQEPGEMFGEISAIDGRGRALTITRPFFLCTHSTWALAMACSSGTRPLDLC